mmetsp:Transcript_13652/g.22373  ORF Transcript_13652/g.22373 Transcript_13652/m.22373 type:complete len:108 (-) Transcript_13652:20-343(-)
MFDEILVLHVPVFFGILGSGEQAYDCVHFVFPRLETSFLLDHFGATFLLLFSLCLVFFWNHYIAHHLLSMTSPYRTSRAYCVVTFQEEIPQQGSGGRCVWGVILALG